MLSITVGGFLALLCLVGAKKIPPPKDRIVGGDFIMKQEVPYHVSLLEDGSHVCGGSILNEKFILTAAHCLEGTDPKENTLEVRAGSGKVDEGGTVIKVDTFRVHSFFNSYMNFDVAVLKLKSPLTFSSTIKSIELVDEKPAHDTLGFVCGFGLTENGGRELSPKIKGTTLNVISREKCMETAYKKNIQESMFCAAADGTDACEGDSGGPFVVGDPPKQAGIVSFSFACADPLYPGVYTDVARVKNFIEKAMKEL